MVGPQVRKSAKYPRPFQRCSDVKRNEKFVIYKEEDEDGGEMMTEEEERVFRGAERRYIGI